VSPAFCLRESLRRRLEGLASVFGIDVLTYAVMSNSLHLILHNRPGVAEQCCDEQVTIRWQRGFPGRRLEVQFADATQKDAQTLANQSERTEWILRRLLDICWFWKAAGKMGGTFR